MLKGKSMQRIEQAEKLIEVPNKIKSKQEKQLMKNKIWQKIKLEVMQYINSEFCKTIHAV